MSTINTNGLDVNYPVPGVNNNSQGFRNNFSAIKTNLDTAGNEITDLQNKVVLKAALTNSTLNNDMANTLISNAATSGFRSTTYNLGNALSGTVYVDVSIADVHYGTVTDNVSFEFGGWSPPETQSSIMLQLGISNANAVISFPSQVISTSDDYGVTLLENYANVANVPTVTAPSTTTQVNFKLTSADCGNSIYIEPINRPYQSTQIQTRAPAPTGLPGDTSGAVCVDPAVTQLLISDTTLSPTNTLTTTGDTVELYSELPIIFTGNTFGGITAGTTYYVKDVVTSNTFTVSSSIGGSNVTLSSAVGNMYANPITYLYVATNNYTSTVTGKTVTDTYDTTNLITLGAPGLTTDYVNAPIIFEGTMFGGLEANIVYYVKAISGTDITISRTRNAGVAGTEVILTTDSGNASACLYTGSDIWKRVALTPW